MPPEIVVSLPPTAMLIICPHNPAPAPLHPHALPKYWGPSPHFPHPQAHTPQLLSPILHPATAPPLPRSPALATAPTFRLGAGGRGLGVLKGAEEPLGEAPQAGAGPGAAGGGQSRGKGLDRLGSAGAAVAMRLRHRLGWRDAGADARGRGVEGGEEQGREGGTERGRGAGGMRSTRIWGRLGVVVRGGGPRKRRTGES